MPSPLTLRRLLVVAALSVTGVTACAGKRGTLADAPVAPTAGGAEGQPVGDAFVDAVLGDLERPMESSFTVTYAVTRKLGSLQASATVSRGPLATSVTIGDVRYVRAEVDRTCLLAAGTCEDTINEARVSDLGLSSLFWRDAPARSLRVAYGRRAAPATGEETTVAGQAARCTSVPLGGGTEVYCSLASGTLARMDTAYVTVELTAFEPTVRQEVFALPTDAPPSGG